MAMTLPPVLPPDSYRYYKTPGQERIDIKGHGGLSLTGEGNALLRGEATFRYRVDAVHRPEAKATVKSAAPAMAELSDPEVSLFNVLRELRLGLAHERGVPAYAVFPDRALADMARRKPASEEQFAEVHGVGAAKLRDFAAPFLDMAFCPTGGVGAGNHADYLALSNVVCVGGSWVATAKDIAACDWPGIPAKAAATRLTYRLLLGSPQSMLAEVSSSTPTCRSSSWRNSLRNGRSSRARMFQSRKRRSSPAT